MNWQQMSDRDLLVHIATKVEDQAKAIESIQDGQQRQNDALAKMNTKVLRAEGAIAVLKWLFMVAAASGITGIILGALR